MAADEPAAKKARLMTPATAASVRSLWEGPILDTLKRYIEIPNQSPLFDPEWSTNGYQEQVVELHTAWAREHAPFAKIEVVKLEDRPPLIPLEWS